MLSSRQQDIIALFSAEPYLHVKDIQEALGLTRARVNQLIVPMIKAGLVRREGRARATVYSLSGKRSMEQITRENWELRRRVGELEKALDDRKIIERAKEILVAQFDILPTEAYRKLQELSMKRGRPISEVAGSITSSLEY